MMKTILILLLLSLPLLADPQGYSDVEESSGSSFNVCTIDWYKEQIKKLNDRMDEIEKKIIELQQLYNSLVEGDTYYAAVPQVKYEPADIRND